MAGQVKRRYLIAGNWKMNKLSSEAVELAEPIVHDLGTQTEVHVALCPPLLSLSKVAESIENSQIHLGAQNMHFELQGAYTGEVSAPMLREWFVSYVILGHSERREYFGETDELINKKVKVALQHTLKPILCIGETEEEYEGGKTLEVVTKQLKGGLEGVTAEQADSLVIAYEPVWAIGTGKNATPEIAQEVHGEIRKQLRELLGDQAANQIRILYGGSMKPENAPDLLAMPDVDGGLIGGASLDPKSFVKIAEAAMELTEA